MPLSSGDKLGPYEIVAPLGAGGMGEVYRATDTQLKRAVALKVLPASVAGDAERLARFQREAEVLAALNHPNIAAIYGLERTADVTALVMELVEGEDLSQRIARGAIPLDEALTIARQITEALEAAHEQGIVHRDLKPANIKVRADGTVKVLDFGLAKALDAPGRSSSNPNISQSPTMSHLATQAGIILGTASYMSPEQAKGRMVDRRTDIFAFSVVLYEMLTGHPAFGGEDVPDILSHVLRSDPNWALLPASVPPAIQKILKLCLEKDVKQRRQAAGDVRIDIEQAMAEPETAVPVAVPARRSRMRWVVAAAAVVGFAALAYMHFVEAPPEQPVMHVSLPIPDGAVGYLSLSPDGRRVAAGFNRLAVRNLDGDQWTPIESARGAHACFWSPDGRFIGFFAAGKLKTVSATGGPAKELCGETGLGVGGACQRGCNRIIFVSCQKQRIGRLRHKTRSRNLPEKIAAGIELQKPLSSAYPQRPA